MPSPNATVYGTTPPLRELDLVPFEDLVGRAEIAKREGVTKAGVDTWRRRYPDFPEPVVVISSTPVWRWSEVNRWLRATSRKRGRPRKLERSHS